MTVDEKEIEVLISCIKMAAAESFYLLYRENIPDGEEIIENVLRKFGVEDRKISLIMEGWT